MGHKGVSKRKPKKSKLGSNDNNNGSSKSRPGESPSVQALENAKDAPLKRGSMNPSTGWNRTQTKRQIISLAA